MSCPLGVYGGGGGNYTFHSANGCSWCVQKGFPDANNLLLYSVQFHNLQSDSAEY